MEFVQRRLITGFYHCDGCGRMDAESIVRYKGRRLCPVCVARIVPSCDPLRGGDGVVRTDAERDEVAAFWDWHWESQRVRPPRYSPPRKALEKQERAADEYYPVCDCGRTREAAKFGRGATGLFGGPFMKECPMCDARRQVEGHVRASSWLHREWDDEEWLDLLWKAMPEAFEFGVLPGYWFELRRGVERMGD